MSNIEMAEKAFKFKNVIRLDESQVPLFNKIALKHNCKKAHQVMEVLFRRYMLVEDLMKYCGAKTEEQFVKIAMEYLPKNSAQLKTKLANDFLMQLKELGLISTETYEKLADAIFPILLNGSE